MGKRFWNFKAAAGDNPPELVLYGEISEASWFGDEVTPAQFNADLKALGDANELLVRLNSPGGDVFAAQAIYTMLRQHPARVTMRVDGLAASAATIILMAGDRIQMPANAMLMVHNPWTVAAGDANGLRDMADTLDTVRETMLAVYTARTGQTVEQITELLDAETWLTAEKAAALGFADEVLSLVRVDAKLRGENLWQVNGTLCDLSAMKSQPLALLYEPEPPASGAEGIPPAVADVDAALIPANAEGGTRGEDNTEPAPVEAAGYDPEREAARRARILTLHRR
jgi:ATP-dependent Clp protease protease subunit